ncbi:MAG TPA: hypothetical protein VGK47_14885 [Nitrososphaeraceae archaeon]
MPALNLFGPGGKNQNSKSIEEVRMQVVELNKRKKTTVPKAEAEALIKSMRKEHEKLVKGKFEFIDAQGGWLDFSYRYFPGDPLVTIKLTHGEVTELPMGIVKHLNNTVKKIRKMNPDILESGPVRGVPATYEKQSRIRFTPVDFL